jgi:hypothetical protein
MSLPKCEPAQGQGRRAGQQDVAKGGKRPPVEAADRGTDWKDIPRVGARTLAPGNHAPSAAIACGPRPAASGRLIMPARGRCG